MAQKQGEDIPLTEEGLGPNNQQSEQAQHPDNLNIETRVIEVIDGLYEDQNGDFKIVLG